MDGLEASQLENTQNEMHLPLAPIAFDGLPLSGA